MIDASQLWLARCGLPFAIALLPPVYGLADVVSNEPNGFEVRHTVQIAATPDKVYAALTQPARWWNSQHSWSGSASNLTLDAQAGGCFCEKLPEGGSVQHLAVVMVKPGKELRMRGALGPFQSSGADGAMAIVLKENAQRTEVTLTYTLGGYVQGGFVQWAPKVDGMLAEQIGRLKKLLETGSPDTH